jgi:hypothetical protein
LTRLDENTRRLHPQAEAEARAPNKAELGAAVRVLAGEVAQARERHVTTVLYLVYAGHGNVRDGEGYILVEDAHLTGEDLLRDILRPIGANTAHVIVDACYSYFLAYARGPGGTRRTVSGFSRFGALAQESGVGLLLSTSSGRESHEWEGLQAGVFSHEVRSGLYGAADADGDGQVSYQEMAAFVARANQAIPNEKYRPDVLARPPADSANLVDLRPALNHRIEIDGAHAAHYLLEDSRGVRVADFHNAAGVPVRLVRPLAEGHLYLRRADETEEFSIPAGPEPVAIAQLAPEEPRARARGAAHDAFSKLFELPFDRSAVAGVQLERELTLPIPEGRHQSKVLGAVLLGAGVVAAAVAAGFLADGVSQRNASSGINQAEIARRNIAIARDNRVAQGAGVAVAVAGASGVGLWVFGRF